MLDQRLHRRIEAVALLELDGETFGEIARADAGRIERLQDREHGLDVAARRAELVGDRVEIAGEIAGLVHHIDQVLPDHAAGRIGNRQRHLLGEMIGQRDLGRDEGFQIIVAVLAAAGADARPFRIGRRRRFDRRRLFSPPSSGKTFSSSVPSPSSIEVRLVSRSSPIQSAVAAASSPASPPRRFGAALRLGAARRRVVVVLARSSSGFRSSSPST